MHLVLNLCFYSEKESNGNTMIDTAYGFATDAVLIESYWSVI